MTTNMIIIKKIDEIMKPGYWTGASLGDKLGRIKVTYGVTNYEEPVYQNQNQKDVYPEGMILHPGFIRKPKRKMCIRYLWHLRGKMHQPGLLKGLARSSIKSKDRLFCLMWGIDNRPHFGW